MQPITDKSPAIIIMLVVLVLVYFSNSGKLGAIKAIIQGPPNPESNSTVGTAPVETTPPAGTNPPATGGGHTGGSHGGLDGGAGDLPPAKPWGFNW